MNRIAMAAAWLTLILLVGAVVWSWASEGLAHDLMRGDVTAAEKLQSLRATCMAAGPLAPVVYVLLVTIEVVVAPIPGLMLYAPGGVIFGPWWGGTLSLAGNVLGAGLACVLARSVRPTWLDRAAASGTAQRLQTALQRRAGVTIFLLRLNPLTSSDLVSYAAGLAKIPTGKVMLATGAGMAPLCFAQSWLASSVLDAMPSLIYLLVALLAAYVLVVVVVVHRLASPNQAAAGVQRDSSQRSTTITNNNDAPNSGK